MLIPWDDSKWRKTGYSFQCKMFTKDEAAALPQALYYLFDWQKNVPRVVMIETVRLSYLAVIRSGFNPVEIFVRGELHNTSHKTRQKKWRGRDGSRRLAFDGASIIETTPKADRTRRFKSKQPFWLAKAKLFDRWDTVSARAAGNRINIGRSKGSGGKLKQ
ncbi:hypothetical protein E4U30_007266 [Claviceps sp. LM220 group G6]|nr:hypothetical protein E4U30_007266 [Claviceps sp. LM220 group G6]